MKVFVIDDCEIDLTLIAKQLRKINDVEVFTYVSVPFAVSKFDMQPEVFIVDYTMPVFNGLEVLALIKEKLPDSLVIMVSVQESVDVFSDAFIEGVDHYVQKGDDFIYKVQDLVQNYYDELHKKKTLWDNIVDVFTVEEKLIVTKKTVFFIDDDVWFRTLVSHDLGKEKLITLKMFETIKECFDGLNENPDVVILDHYINDSNSMELAEFIKRNKPNILLIVFSNQNDLEIALKYKEVGVDFYLKKSKKNIKMLSNLIMTESFV